MRISVQVSTGKIIEMQSDATPGTLIRNAVAQGIAENDVVEENIDQNEYQARMLVQEPPVPVVQQPTVRDVVTALKAKNLLTDADFDTAAKGNKGSTP